jgi:hypothetical protein
MLLTAATAAADPRGEVIVIHDQAPPKQLPRSVNYPVYKLPPYSDKAILADAWTRAWMLLDISDTGEVRRFKWIKRPGYDLEAIAAAEVWKIKFDPARDAHDRPIALHAMWMFEWPSVGWLNVIENNPRTKAPSHHSKTLAPFSGDPYWYIPCTGQSTVNFDSVYPVTRDCSTPDLARAEQEPWVTRPR